ncbi:MAG: CHAT domain-containing protein [Candidatus Krumholzibacteria bacterium]|nr:CHAT domain-containing protein [Candidatus Krumholzibacteria bacterium]MDH4336592.1 CHAT domain-containing protein [Candidatus Krumholzibacteria bacterium]MDH5270194.1 CHAT domain-containing protein [Candidatus Krumholzibacteria bacterium]MDH5627348.1 CHAT domain-containing protein [Candidatus Krumholzibacteria bacterium]
MPSAAHIRFLFVLLLLAAPALLAAPPDPDRYDALADSLFTAAAYDSMLALSSRSVEAALARGDSVMLGRMLVARGRARAMLRIPGSRADFDRAVLVSRTVGDSTGWSAALGLQSLMAAIDGRFDECIALNEQRNEIARAIGSVRGLGWGHTLIGYACLMQGKLERAELEYREAVANFQQADRPRDELEALIGLGRVYNSSGRLEEARSAYHDALDIAREQGDRRQEADCWNNLGGLELERGELSRAAEYFRRSYDLKRAEGSYDVSSPAVNVALANTLVGHYAAAESVLVDAIQDAHEWGFKMIFSDVYGTLGHLRMAQHRPRGAAVYFRRAVARGDTGTVEARLDAAAGLAAALAAQDSVAAALDVLEGQSPGFLDAPSSAARGDGLIEWSRCLRAAGDPVRAETMARAALADATARDDPGGAVLASLEISAARRAMGDPEGGYAWFDRARAMYSESSGRSGEYQWREAFRASLAPPLVAGAVALLEWPPGASRREREGVLFDFLQEVRARTLMERITDPRRADEGANVVAMVTAAQLQRQTLRPGECLLDISAGTRNVFVFAVTRDSLRLCVIDDADGMIERRGTRYCSLAGSPGARDITADATPAELLSGVRDILDGVSSIIVIADGWVASLPFAALSVDGEALLIDRYEISAVPAASLLHDLRARPQESPLEGVLAFAPVGAALPGARREVRELALHYAGVQAVDSALAGAALAELARERGVVHVASHVDVNGERPWHSGIQLGPDGRDAGYLRASEIVRDDFRERLVVLSSCESALGRATQGEGVLGITTAFLGAGARSVVATLWKVDDRTTSDLMLAFYDGLKAGLPAGRALRAAQLAVRREHPSPFYWAGFVMVGDAAVTVHLTPRPRPHILMVSLIFGVLALTGTVIAGFRRRLFFRM